MGKYSERITDQSEWLSVIPNALSLSMPFFVTEMGHFFAESDYAVERQEHDSFLLLYTQNGCGAVQSYDSSILLPAGHAVLVDCHKFHKYHTLGDSWEFLWLHIKGSAAAVFFDILYPDHMIFAVAQKNPEHLHRHITSLTKSMPENDIVSCTFRSSVLHQILNLMIQSSLEQELERKNLCYTKAVESVTDFIRQHYAEAISIDDMLQDVPFSKYHFIRSFKRTMGSTPYHYLTNYRITVAKTLLRSTEESIAAIAEHCGFSDTSNFITHFRKATGQNPLQYRKYFGG